jgi:hypothetical protein
MLGGSMEEAMEWVMARSKVITSHTSSRRDSWWYLEQDEDGSLHVRYENDDDHSLDWRKPLHEFIASGWGTIQPELQSLINRMFDDHDAARS